MEPLTAATFAVRPEVPQRLRTFGRHTPAPLHELVGITDTDGRTGWGEWVPGTSMAAAYASARSDLAARSARLPLALHLSPVARTTLEVNAVLGAAEGAGAAEDAVGRGFRTLKLKVGQASPDADVKRVREVRAAVGDLVGLRVDANGSWSRDDAELVLRALAPAGLEFAEQPVPADDIASMAHLRRLGAIAIVADEATLDCAAVDALAAADAADGVMVKVARVGGPAAAMRLADRARSHGFAVYVSSLWESPVGHAVGVHTAAAIGPDGACGFADVAGLDGVIPLEVRAGAVDLAGCVGCVGCGVDPTPSLAP